MGISFFAPMIASAQVYGYTDGYQGYNMMGYGMMGYGGGISVLFSLAILVWIVVGVLVSIFLWKKINKKDSGHTEK